MHQSVTQMVNSTYLFRLRQLSCRYLTETDLNFYQKSFRFDYLCFQYRCPELFRLIARVSHRLFRRISKTVLWRRSKHRLRGYRHRRQLVWRFLHKCRIFPLIAVLFRAFCHILFYLHRRDRREALFLISAQKEEPWLHRCPHRRANMSASR